MATKNAVFMGSDALLQATGLRDVESNDLINTATITLSIFEGVRRYPVSILPFTDGGGGTKTIAVGDTVEGETDGATALVGKVDVTSGYWSAGTAAGLLELSGQDGVFRALGETLKVGVVLDIATIASDSKGIIAISAAAGAKTQIPMNTTGLTTNDFIRLESTKNYNGQYDIDAIEDGLVTIVEPYIAEIFTGNEVIYIGIGGGKDIALTHVGGDADGYYDGIQPDTLEGVYHGADYFLFEKITYAGNVILHRYNWPADYYSNEATS